MPVSIAGLLESGGSAKPQEKPASTLLLSSGNAGSCCKRWYPCFRLAVKLFTNLQNPFPFPRAPGNGGEENQEPVYRDSVIPHCQSCIPAGIFATYMTDWDIESSMEFLDFLLHTFILHKPLIFTTSLKRFVIKSRCSFYAENLLCPRWQVERKERTQRRFLSQKGAPRQR